MVEQGLCIPEIFLYFRRFEDISSLTGQSSTNNFLNFLNEKENVATIAFLSDIFKYINELNLKLQGKGRLVCELISEVRSFSRKLDLLKNDVDNDRLHFPNLKLVDGANDIEVGQYKTFISDLKSEFTNRFADFKKIENVVEILKNI